jgi:hypothetical protein
MDQIQKGNVNHQIYNGNDKLNKEKVTLVFLNISNESDSGACKRICVNATE